MGRFSQAGPFPSVYAAGSAGGRGRGQRRLVFLISLRLLAGSDSAKAACFLRGRHLTTQQSALRGLSDTGLMISVWFATGG